MGGFLQSKTENRTRIHGQKRKFDDDSSDSYKELDSSIEGVLRTKDGGKFQINRNLLARQCPFFKALFGGNFGDGTDVLLRGIDSETLESILVYLYTGTIQLNEENATDILVASDYLLIDPLLQKSRSFVLKEMTTTNCVPLFLTVWRIEGLSILNNCHRFIVIHFEEFVSESEEIGCLPLAALKNFLKEKSLNISSERTVWNAIVKWIKFDLSDRLKFVPELLRYISLEDLDNPLMNDIISHNMIQENNFCQDLIFSELQQTEQLQNFRQILISKSNMTASRIPTNSHLIIYNCIEHSSFEKNIYITWDGEIDYWLKLGRVHFFPDYIFQLDRYVYMFDTTINISLAFDIFHKKCLPMTPIYQSRCYYSVVSVKGFIYIMGGRYNHLYNIEDIERFDPRTGKWKLVSRMVPMSLSNAVALNGYIYAIGYNRDVTNPKMMIQVYDPASDRWSSVSAPRLFKPEITAFAFGGQLYIIAGKTFGCVSRSIEKYDPVKDVWIPMPDLPFAYRTPRAVVLNDVLIVYEEHIVYRSCGKKTPPVYWVPENRTWNTIQDSSPLQMIRLFKICTITESNVIKFFAKQNRKQSKSWVKSPLA
ncbi:Kelch-like protein 10 [Araneus ventricosus]|uniref:Kelch-like protein diablo n=1 Tax=Araneus ventricosus TaxID=182803 RepID=A0A4Y2PEC6_ARAVE|nr:Kelch-like protein 10 [Araneus ventricosus]